MQYCLCHFAFFSSLPFRHTNNGLPINAINQSQGVCPIGVYCKEGVLWWYAHGAINQRKLLTCSFSCMYGRGRTCPSLSSYGSDEKPWSSDEMDDFFVFPSIPVPFADTDRQMNKDVTTNRTVINPLPPFYLLIRELIAIVHHVGFLPCFILELCKYQI